MTSQNNGSLHAAYEIRELLETIKEGDHIPPSFSPEFYALYLEASLLAGAVPFAGSSVEELAEFILPSLRMTREEFDTRSKKDLARLFYEWEISDMHLVRNAQGNILRFASNARTEIHVPRLGISLQEVGRTYLRTGLYVEHPEPKRHASSETMRRRRRGDSYKNAESPVTAAQAGLLEEWGRKVNARELVPLTPRMPEIHRHESSAFAIILSIVTSWKFRLDLESPDAWDSPKIMHRGDTLVVEDDDVLLHTRWLPT